MDVNSCFSFKRFNFLKFKESLERFRATLLKNSIIEGDISDFSSIKVDLRENNGKGVG